jgi:hypothetical protein
MDILKLWQATSRTATTLGSFLNVVKGLTHNQPEQFSAEVLNLLQTDPLAHELLFKDIAQMEAGLAELRAALAAKMEIKS